MNVLEAYQGLAEANGLPAMVSATVEVERQLLSEPAATWRWLEAQRPVAGWVLFQSNQRVFRDGLPVATEEDGVLLAAEAVTEEGHSLALQQANGGGWQGLLYRHGEAVEGDMTLADEVQLIAHATGAETLHYRRYWQHEAGCGFVQRAACLVGIDQGGSAHG